MKVNTINALKQLLLSSIVVGVLALSFTQTLDNNADRQLSDSFKHAMATFALVRGINAVISVVQGTEVALEPGGLGVVLTPGEVFDPINDLIERFSWVVLAAGTSLGAQLILLKIGTSVVAQWLVFMAGGILITCIWTPVLVRTSWRNGLIKISIIVIFVRFLVPIVVLTNELFYSTFLNDSYTSSHQVLENVSKDIKELQEDNSALARESEEGILNSIERFYERTTQGMNISSRYREYEAKVSGAITEIINLIAVFIFQTLVFPLIFLWLVLKLGRFVVSDSFWIQSPSDKQVSKDVT